LSLFAAASFLESALPFSLFDQYITNPHVAAQHSYPTCYFSDIPLVYVLRYPPDVMKKLAHARGNRYFEKLFAVKFLLY